MPSFIYRTHSRSAHTNTCRAILSSNNHIAINFTEVHRKLLVFVALSGETECFPLKTMHTTNILDYIVEGPEIFYPWQFL